MMAFVAILAWAGICCAVAGLLYLTFLLLEPRNQPLSYEPDGDWPTIPDDLKVHAHPNTRTGV
jgi:hypothetical protein